MKHIVKENIKFDYQSIVIDESQDLTQLYYELIIMVKERCNSVPNIYIAGDHRQQIYSFKGSDSKYFIHCDRYFNQDFECIEQKESKRITKQMAELVNSIYR